MTCRQHRNGGKFHGRHTTYIDTAAEIADHAVTLDEVTGILSGVISSGIGNCGGRRHVKISDMLCERTKRPVGILLVVRENGGAQRIFIRSFDIKKTKLSIAKYAIGNNIHVNFREAQKIS